ncbi:uncharacterized protein BT62DRAFT_1003381 [Guyanagaster necrorhizus]|uniref:Secreted protein n=1 Tax=Guyanagaster necrorhizus TaxID=856835 RepID=A0A9P8AUM9_9AGAR|nr:uncharacterized protein BT62DRAFT_1003381 [Guyanagaster necrorhizus MCA 3950]KAG7448669.1 hypothetical protein BT62DRAFT_1003381 [Guyanagaster necrorhizus MCA 3950]
MAAWNSQLAGTLVFLRALLVVDRPNDSYAETTSSARILHNAHIGISKPSWSLREGKTWEATGGKTHTDLTSKRCHDIGNITSNELISRSTRDTRLMGG